MVMARWPSPSIITPVAHWLCMQVPPVASSAHSHSHSSTYSLGDIILLLHSFLHLLLSAIRKNRWLWISFSVAEAYKVPYFDGAEAHPRTSQLAQSSTRDGACVWRRIETLRFSDEGLSSLEGLSCYRANPSLTPQRGNMGKWTNSLRNWLYCYQTVNDLQSWLSGDNERPCGNQWMLCHMHVQTLNAVSHHAKEYYLFAAISRFAFNCILCWNRGNMPCNSTLVLSSLINVSARLQVTTRLTSFPLDYRPEKR